MDQKPISIIMPVYNGAKFIKETLDSLLGQVTPQVEIIVVDDGSQDNTLEILHQNYESLIESQQLRIYAQANQGVSAARNYGLSLAQGEFIGFMDADDLALPDYIHTLLNAVSLESNSKIDIVEFGFKTFIDSASGISQRPTLYSNAQFGLNPVAKVIDQVYSTARWYPWSRLFRASLFNDVRFPAGISFCEDLMTIPKLYEKAKTILVLPEALYGYRINPNSATFKVGQNYVDNLVRFYHLIPSSNLIRNDYLRLSVAYAIYSCQTKATGNWQLPQNIQEDLYGMRWNLSIYRHIETRRIAILLYPVFYRHFKKLFRFFGKK